MQCIDASLNHAVENFIAKEDKIPAAGIMANTGKFIVHTLLDNAPQDARYLFFCGSGTNGGYGYAAAIELTKRGYKAYCVDVTGKTIQTPATKYFFTQYLLHVGHPIHHMDMTKEVLKELATTHYAFIDCIYGSEFSKKKSMPKEISDMIQNLNEIEGVKKYAVDIPTGLSGSTGEMAEVFFKTDYTLETVIPKRGYYLYPASMNLGKQIFSNVEVNSQRIIENFKTDCIMDEEVIKKLLPMRQYDLHKGSAGRVGIICGSKKYPGAALLACESALYMGSGYVCLYSDEEVCKMAVSKFPSLLIKPYKNITDAVTEADKECDVLLIGCGLEPTVELRKAIDYLIVHSGCPLILDAGALTCYEKHSLRTFVHLQGIQRHVLVTPHLKEFSVMTGMALKDLEANYYKYTKEIAADCHISIVLKGPTTLIAATNRNVYLNISGNNALAKAGSGDVLAGAIASLSAFMVKQEPKERHVLTNAAAIVTYLHGRAGSELSKIYSLYGVNPTMLPPEMAKILAKILP